MQEQVDLGDGPGAEVLLLPIEGQGADVLVAILEVLNRLQQHTARAASGVVDRHAGLGVHAFDHQMDDLPGRVELAALLARPLGEHLDEIHVCVAQNVRRDVGIPQPIRLEM